MALVRCVERHDQPDGKTCNYVKKVRPVGHPNPAVICGIPGCTNLGMVWLNSDEEKAYRSGQRIFEPHSHAVQIKVE